MAKAAGVTDELRFLADRLARSRDKDRYSPNFALVEVADIERAVEAVRHLSELLARAEKSQSLTACKDQEGSAAEVHADRVLPEGWIAVPREITDEMEMAGVEACPMFPMPEMANKSGRASLTSTQLSRIFQAMALSSPPAPGFERVRHMKRGDEYDVLGEAEAQVSTGQFRCWASLDPDVPVYVRELRDGLKLTVYRSASDGKLWIRFPDEFRDGRFEGVEETPWNARRRRDQVVSELDASHG